MNAGAAVAAAVVLVVIVVDGVAVVQGIVLCSWRR